MRVVMCCTSPCGENDIYNLLCATGARGGHCVMFMGGARGGHC